jgi:hypothetical protein
MGSATFPNLPSVSYGFIIARWQETHYSMASVQQQEETHPIFLSTARANSRLALELFGEIRSSTLLQEWQGELTDEVINY